MINQLDTLVAALPIQLQTAFKTIFTWQKSLGQAIPPPEMQPWVEQHFGTIQAVQQQHILKIPAQGVDPASSLDNQYTNWLDQSKFRPQPVKPQG